MSLPISGIIFLCFLTLDKKISKRKALAFNQDICCHLMLCLRLILFRYLTWVKNQVKAKSWSVLKGNVFYKCNEYLVNPLSIKVILVLKMLLMREGGNHWNGIVS